MPKMIFVQGGADFKGPKTKKQLKEVVKLDPSLVMLYDTSAFGSDFNDTADKLPKNMTFNVVGPDPYKARNWYASVYRGRNGELVVK